MYTVTVDCAAISDRAGFHAAVARGLALPCWYGNNLDALHDCLTEISSDTCLRFQGWPLLEQILGPYARAARNAITHAAQVNPRLLPIFE